MSFNNTWGKNKLEINYEKLQTGKKMLFVLNVVYECHLQIFVSLLWDLEFKIYSFFSYFLEKHVIALNVISLNEQTRLKFKIVSNLIYILLGKLEKMPKSCFLVN